MSILKHKLFLLILVTLIIGAAFIVFFYESNKDVSYYLNTQKDYGLQINDPVFVVDKKVGYITDIEMDSFGKGYFVKFTIPDDISLTDRSILNIDTLENNSNSINIVLKSSHSYLVPGDTIFLNGELEEMTKQKIQLVNAESDQIHLVYKIQLLSSKQQMSVTSEKFMELDNVEEMMIDGLYKYYYGNAFSIRKAKELRQRVVDSGISDAFIVPFHKGQRISLRQALSLEK